MTAEFNELADSNNRGIPELQSPISAGRIHGTRTDLADCQLAVVASASFASVSLKRCVTILWKGNRSRLTRRKSRAARRWRGSLDQEPKTCSCLRVMMWGLNSTVPALQ